MNPQSITLGGGCFWWLDAVYELVDGVRAVESGYANGHVSEPSDEQVCGGDTGHVEVAKLSFDAERISLREVLQIFFAIHDPTTVGRQGNDVGSQYRAGIDWSDPAHEAVAREVLAEAEAAHHGRVVTERLALDNDWRAEEDHQRYLANHPGVGHCAFVVAPKVEKFRKTLRLRVRSAA